MSIIQTIFGCAHRKTSFPLTPIRRLGNTARATSESKAQTYIACLDCGKELPYDWDTMQKVATSRWTLSLKPAKRAVI